MAVRQYVGARYVPKFYQNSQNPLRSDWESNKAYEALTIVQYNNSSYTSKIPVPTGIGNPAQNPTYWVNTGDYNAQVEQYRQETVALGNDVGKNATNINNLQIDVNALDKVKLDWINAIEYGFSTEEFNDAIMNQFITNDSENVLYFPKGIYNFQSGFDFPNNCHIVMHPEATLKLNGTDVQDCFISIRHNSTRNDYSTNSFIVGGTIDANYKANRIFGCSKIRTKKLLSQISLLNSLKYGIDTMYNTIVDGQSGYSDIRIENTKNIEEIEVSGTTGIYDRGLDSEFSNIEVVNFQIAASTINGTFTTFHPWIRSKNIIPESIGIYLRGFGINLSNITIDTFQYPLYIEATHNRGANISNLVVTYGSPYTKELLDTNPLTIFKFNSDFAGTLNLKVINAIIPPDCEFLSNSFHPLSSFINIRSSTGVTSNIKNYVSSDRDITIASHTLVTDQFGQVSIQNMSNLVGLAIISPFEITYVPISNGLRIYKIDASSHTLSLLPNTTVKVRCIYSGIYNS